MPRGYWRIIIAVIGITIAATSYAQPINKDTARQEAAGRSSQTPEQDPSVSDSLRRIAGSLESQANDPAAAEEQERTKQDLEAQQSMAFWTRFMAWVSLGALALSTYGVILIRNTFEETRRAGNAATNAVNEGRIANQIARRAAAHSEVNARETMRMARETAKDNKAAAFVHKRIERAYLCPQIERDQIKVGPRCVTITPSIVNAGKTQGELIGICAGFLANLPDEVSYGGAEIIDYPLLIVPAGGDVEVSPFESPEGMRAFFFAGYIIYRDLFRDQHMNRFCYRIDLGKGTSNPAGGEQWHTWD